MQNSSCSALTPNVSKILALLTTFVVAVPDILLALPIGFGRHQGDLNYNEIVTDDFLIYHDERTQKEAFSILHALKAAKPKLEQWIGEKRSKPLPVIMSATTMNASFANFITDALELQTFGRGDRDLAWHELTHNIMYLHFTNIFGPTGSILHLPWMPAWMIEGLAEATSSSIGSNWQAGVERYFAIHGGWPSYVKLHNLYRPGFSRVGYALSGAFVSYLLDRCGTEKLPQFFKDFYDYTMPWYWPLTIVPFSGFMPFDQALVNYCSQTGEQMYESYKKAATSYWQTATNLTGPYLPKTNKSSPKTGHTNLNFSSENAFSQLGRDLYFIDNQENQIKLFKLHFDEKSNSAHQIELVWNTDNMRSLSLAHNRQTTITTIIQTTNDRKLKTEFFLDDKAKPIFSRQGYVQKLFLTEQRLFWLETHIDTDQICYIDQAKIKQRSPHISSDIRCPLTFTYPQSLSFLGSSEKKSSGSDVLNTDLIWFSLDEETLAGNRYSIIQLDMTANRSFKLPVKNGGKPLSFAIMPSRKYLWGLFASHNNHVIRLMKSNGECLKQAPLANLGSRIFAPSDDKVVISSWSNGVYKLYKNDISDLNFGSCQNISSPGSPLLHAIQYDTPFDEAIDATRIWSNPLMDEPSYTEQQENLRKAPLLSQASPQTDSQPNSKEASWRSRPVFAFPWIAAGARGYQFGVLSVPLMDHMQNETVTATALYGSESRFPSIQLSLNSTRFQNGLGLDAFRQQTWNGVKQYKISEQLYQSTLYYEEIGTRIRTFRTYPASQFLWRFDFIASQLKPLYGPTFTWQDEPNGEIFSLVGSLQKSYPLPQGSLGLTLTGELVPELINRNFAYDKLDLALSYNWGLRIFDIPSTQIWGLQLARTRGAKPKNLKEVYRPLKTFVPGSGGGLNEVYLNLLGLPYLTNGTFGDTKSRLKFAWTFPVSEDLERMLHIVYLERLDFTAFFNYGRAWYGDTPPQAKDFIAAHGYNLDLQADVKGVNLNVGLGVGQVIGYPFELYFLFGFDTLINQ